ADAVQRESPSGAGGGGQRRATHPARPARLLAVRCAHEGSVGPTDLLDRRRRHHVERRGGFGFPRRAGWLRLGHAPASGPHELPRPRQSGILVARPVDELRGARARLVETLQERGIRDLAVLRAFEMTPRHAFVPTGLRHRAYEDAPLPIGNGQTISQPWVHARYLELLHLTGKERVLEIGTGSGYQTVLLAHLVAQVFSIER